MKRISAMAAVFFAAWASLAEVPQLLNYQGRLLDGTNLVNGSVGLSLRLYDAASGGALLYEDSNTVAVVDGLYATCLGDQTNAGNFASALTNAQVWIETAVNGAALSPRERLTAAAYALLADGVKAGGVTAVMLADGAVTSGKLAAGAVTAVAIADGAVQTAALADRAVTGAKLDRTTEAAAGAVPAMAARSSQYAGYAVCGLSSNRYAVGVPATMDGGEVMVLSTDGTLVNLLNNSTMQNGAWFGCALAEVGTNRLAVGAYYYDGSQSDEGAVYVYDLDSMMPPVGVTNPVPATNDQFGVAVAALGRSGLIVGARNADATATDAGAAYLYDLAGGLQATLAPPTAGINQHFGASVAGLGDSLILVGAPQFTGPALEEGRVYLFNAAGTLQATVTNPAPGTQDYFGAAVAALGTNGFAVGAPFQDLGATDAGAVYVYALGGQCTAVLTNPAAASDPVPAFGSALLGLPSGRLLVGAHNSDAGATNAGVAYLFESNGRLLGAITNPAPVWGDQFGYALAAVDADTLVIGAPFADTAAGDSGQAYLYDLADYLPGLVADGARAGSIGAAALSDGAVTSNKMATGSVGTAQIADSSITAWDIGTGEVMSWNIGNGQINNAQMAPNAIASSNIVNGTIVATDVNAASFSNIFWKLDGNAGTAAGTHFLGTTDNKPVEIRAGGLRAGFIMPSNGAPNIVLGAAQNAIASGTRGASVLGGSNNTIAAFADFASIGGGTDNDIGNRSTNAAILGGCNNTIGSDSVWSTIGGGWGNNVYATNLLVTIGGGWNNSVAAYSQSATIAGGEHNAIGTDSDGSAIGGGHNNNVAANCWYVTIAGGYGNDMATNSNYSTISGGFNNNMAANNWYATIAGGHGNAIGTNSHHSAIGGGGNNAVLANSSFATIAGGTDNAIGTNSYYAAIGGGFSHAIGANSAQATVAGGYMNTIGTNAGGSAIGGGNGNDIGKNSVYATVAGGLGNDIGANASYSAIGGGNDNDIGTNAHNSVIGGGGINEIGMDAWYATVAGGYDNEIGMSASYSAIGGGISNNIAANATNSVIGGGSVNSIGRLSRYATVAGGVGNLIGTNAGASAIGGGGKNEIEDNAQNATVAGGYNNVIGTNASYSTIGGGNGNSISPNVNYSAIGGGNGNSIQGGANCSFLGGGYQNSIQTGTAGSCLGAGEANRIMTDAYDSFLGGGQNNTIQGNSSRSFLGGGYYNSIGTNAPYTAIPGGYYNAIGNNAGFAFAAGRQAKANHQGAFVWGDSTAADIVSTNNNSVTMRAYGGFRIFTAAGSTGAILPTGSGSWTSLSDVKAKENFRPVDGQAILDKVAGLNVCEWNYKTQDAAIRHLGPMAQDFQAAFGLGESPTGISTVDADGVALAAIQALAQQNADLRAELNALKAQVKALAAAP